MSGDFLAKGNGRISPASYQQEQLWVSHQLFPQLASYSSPTVHEIYGQFDSKAFERAVRMTVASQESLRTHLELRDGALHQVALDDLSFPLVWESQGETTEARARAAWNLIRLAARQPIDPGASRLFDFRLIKIADDHWLFYTNLHHAITDGWSNGLLIKQISACYRACRGQPATNGVVPGLSYADYASRQLKRQDSGKTAASLDYWARQLAGAPGMSMPVLDRPRPAEQTLRAGTVDFTLDPGVTSGLQAVARRWHVSIYTVLLAVFQLLVHRYSGEADLVIGSPVTDRHGTDLEQTIGFFVNVVPLRSRYSPSRRLEDYVRGVHRTCLDAFRNQAVPFSSILRQLGLQSAISHNPLIQVVFTYNNERPEPFRLDGAEITTQALETGHAQFDLEVDLSPGKDGGYLGRVTYAADLLEEATAKRLAENYQWMLSAVLTDCERPLSAYGAVSPVERREIARWNATAADFPSDRCLHELFEEQVSRTPDAVALVGPECKVTYAELDAAADRIASFLRVHSVGVDSAVGVATQRSAELAAALLGILKAGGAYLPVDPSLPSARVGAIMRDAGASILFTGGQVKPESVEGVWAVDLLAENSPYRADQGPRDGIADAGSPDAVVADRPRPENLVSVYYTSGSTGSPKGVASHHRGWVNRMVCMQRKHQLAPGETVLHKTTLSFDDSALEIFWPLMVGGRVAMLGPGEHRDPRAILDALNHYSCVYLQVVPSMLNALLDELEDQPVLRPERLRNTTSSGEALHPDTVIRFHRLLPGDLHNTWGATEVSIDSTSQTCGAEEETTGGPVAIGRPLENNTVYVLDAEMHQMPVGAVGDLHIGGVGLARGYLGDPARTAAAFVPDPFGQGQRLYRTGDRGRLRPDGVIEFAGRTDHQVKIRGMRVELGEIEATLKRHPLVADAVVLTSPDRGPRQLAAFVVSADGRRELEVQELLAHARRWLPDHMIPATVLFLPELPLTANGKVDRKILEIPPHRLEETTATEPCVGMTEIFVADLWRELLGIRPIGALDDFFALGGHSLMATQFVSRVRKLLSVQLPLASVYAKPTLRALAAEIEELLVLQLENMSEAKAEKQLKEFG